MKPKSPKSLELYDIMIKRGISSGVLRSNNEKS